MTRLMQHAPLGAVLPFAEMLQPGWYAVTTVCHNPAVYRSWLQSYAESTYGVKIVALDAEDPQALRAHLSVSFLGDTLWYVVVLPLHPDPQILQFLTTYQGPHAVIVLAPAETLPSALLQKALGQVNLPDRWTQASVNQWLPMLTAGPVAPGYIEELFVRAPSYEFLVLRNLLRVGELLGARYDEFFQAWYMRLVTEPVILYELAQHFFARAPLPFRQAWKAAQINYGPEFWSVYWSEQIMQAIAFLIAKQAGGAAGGDKKKWPKLPFSFIKKDFSLHAISDLIRLHDAIYQADRGIKQGGNEGILEHVLCDYIIRKGSV